MRMWGLWLALAGLLVASGPLAGRAYADCVLDGGVPDDVDGDGVPDSVECRGACPNTDMDMLTDLRDPDDDNDGLLTCEERPGNVDRDSDGDGKPDYVESDDDADGLSTLEERPDASDRDSDGDGVPDHRDADDDDDGILTRSERLANGDRDTDKDDIPDHLDTDDDGDGVDTVDEGDASKDTDKDTIPDYLDAVENEKPSGDGGAGTGGDAAAGSTGGGGSGGTSGGGTTTTSSGGLVGGGLCSVSWGSSSGASFYLLALCAVLVLRRRWTFLVTLLCLSAATSAAAQVPINSSSALPLPNDGFRVSRPETPGHLKSSGLLLIDYGKDPLLFRRDLDKKGELGAVVATSIVAHVAFGLGLGERTAVYASIPVSLVMSGDAGTKAVAPPAEGAGLMDVALGGRVMLVGKKQDPFALAGELVLHVPTADLADGKQVYRGEPYGSVEPALVGEGRFGGSSLGARLAGRFRKPSDVLNVRAEQDLLLAGALRVRVVEGIEAQLEVFGSTPFSEPLAAERSPLEALLGLRGQASSVMWGVAAGPGLSRGFGTPQVRALALVGYAPGARADARPQTEQSKQPPPVGPRVDNDHDGVFDREDACPKEPEDRDGYDDIDGCPDIDNDQDGVLDAQDKCQGELEDTDDFQDEDGCPEADNDSDGIPDEVDECPDVSEDKDGLADADGCAEDDADADSVPDKDDACPSDAGIPDALGCPLVME